MARFAVFMKVSTARLAKSITWEHHENSLFIKVTNRQGKVSVYPMTNYNRDILKRAGRELGEGCYK